MPIPWSWLQGALGDLANRPSWQHEGTRYAEGAVFRDKPKPQGYGDRGDTSGEPMATAATFHRGMEKTVDSSVDIAAFVTSGAIPLTTVRHWLFNGTDTKIVQGRCVVQWLDSSTISWTGRPSTRGRWNVSVVQQDDARTYRPLTQPIQVVSPRDRPFLLGSTAGRIREGLPVYLQIEYESRSAAASEPVFWQDAERLNVTLTLTV